MANNQMQHGGDPMDVGAVRGWSWYDEVGGGYDHEGMWAVGCKGKGKTKGKAREIATIASRRAISRGNAPTRARAKARARYSKENVTTAEKQVIPQESARKAKEES